jgi:threonine dehydrogenase-like Zn-dependent dehydrogenase
MWGSNSSAVTRRKSPDQAVLHSYARAVEMFTAGALNAKPMISHAFALADYGEAIDTFRAGTGRKLQIRPQATESITLL